MGLSLSCLNMGRGRLYIINWQTKMPSTPEIVEAKIRDLSALRVLEKECFGIDAWPLIDLISVLLIPGVVRLKADLNGKMVGFIAADLHRVQHLGWIVTLGVKPGYRRRGIAKSLLLACMANMDVKRYRLSVRKSNQPALNLYAQEGFHPVDTWKHYYADGEDALVLEKYR
jgi:ribosomal protein S18 acetylase RimI-like enzyme